ncbi:MAG: hypothetical protein NTX76_03135 [Alphaproteobacteria bacterium]|nr:hypothetical protein [Alphaproteobacteria bacterium]
MVICEKLVNLDRDSHKPFREVFDRVESRMRNGFSCGSKIFDYAHAVIPFIDFE